MSQLIQILQFALPAVIVIATLEGIVIAMVMRRDYNWRAYLASLADALGRQYFVYTFLPLSLAGPVIDLAWSHRLFTVPLNGAASVVLLVIAQDFSYYWFHRCSHRVRWFWATHAIHHSSNEFNLAASYRFGWTGRLTGAAIFYVPMIWLGFAPGPVFIAAGLNLLYQFWLHAEWIPKLGWLEYVLNTPVAPSRAPCRQSGISRPQLRRHLHRVRSPVRDLRGRAGRPAVPLRPGEAAALQQSCYHRVSRMGGAGARPLAGAVLA